MQIVYTDLHRFLAKVTESTFNRQLRVVRTFETQELKKKNVPTRTYAVQVFCSTAVTETCFKNNSDIMSNASRCNARHSHRFVRLLAQIFVLIHERHKSLNPFSISLWLLLLAILRYAELYDVVWFIVPDMHAGVTQMTSHLFTILGCSFLLICLFALNSMKEVIFEKAYTKASVAMNESSIQVPKTNHKIPAVRWGQSFQNSLFAHYNRIKCPVNSLNATSNA